MDRNLNMVELWSLERFSTVERVAARRMSRSKVVGQMEKRTTTDSCSDKLKETCCGRILFRLLPKSTWVLIPFAVLHIHQPCGFLSQISRPDSGNCHERDGWEGTDNTSPYAHMQTFFSLRATLSTIHPMHQHWLSVFERAFMCFSQVIPSATMSLLGVPEFTPLPPVFTSSTTTPTLTGIRLNPCATPLWSGPSGHLADPIPNTEGARSYLQTFFVDPTHFTKRCCVCVEARDRRTHDSRQKDHESWACEPETSQCRPVRRHRL